MRILGIHDGHNATACLFEDGKIKWVIQEERLRHEKNYDGFPLLAVENILQVESIAFNDIDAVVLNGGHQPKSMSRLERVEAFKALSSSKNKFKSNLKKIKFVDAFYKDMNNDVRINNLVELGCSKDKVHFVNHHEAHASSAYYGLGDYKNEVLVLTNDGAGDRVCATVSIGKSGKLELINKIHENNSIGLLYAMFTFLTGMVPLEHEYKIMGMAPYADVKGARIVADEFHQMFKVSDDGLTWEFTAGTSIYESLDYFKDFMYLKRFDHLMAGLQVFIEEFLVSWVKSAIRSTGIKKVALSGGTFMNVKANKLIMEIDEVEEVFVYPSCGDESNAIGVAYNYFAKHDDYKKIDKLKGVNFGLEWSNEQIKVAYDNYEFKNNYVIEYVENIEAVVAKTLSEGHVVARFNGREEFGARSLGNRAILGNPSTSDVIKTINELIKNRDFWMPFASSILDTDIERYVKMNNKNNPYYMIMTYDTKEVASKELSGGIHPYDKTVRPQLVTKEHNESYWKLLNEFKKLTGIGGLLNTSLNLHGLPLVHTPEHAFEVIDRSRLEFLAIGNYWIRK